MFDRYRGEARSIIKSVIELVWYMRGSIQYNDMMNMSYYERQIISEFIERRMESIKKHPFPIY